MFLFSVLPAHIKYFYIYLGDSEAMNVDSVSIDGRRSLRKAFSSSLLARMNPELILRSYNSRGDGLTTRSLLNYAGSTHS